MISSQPVFLWFLQVSLSITLLWLVYHFAFRNWTFFVLNRLLLIGGMLCCLVFPMLPFSFASETALVSMAQWIPDLVESKAGDVQPGVGPVDRDFILVEYVWRFVLFAYLCGVLAISGRSIRGLMVLRGIRCRSACLSQTGVASVWVQTEMPTFSFCRRIFLNANVLSLPDNAIESVRKHEEAHVRQYHSADNIFFEVLSCVFWFHPCMKPLFAYLRDTHEYLADQEAARSSTTIWDYQQLLARFASERLKHPIVHTFSDSQFYRRVVMLNKPRTKAMESLKLLFLIPVGVVMFAVSACSDQNQPPVVQGRVASEITTGPEISKITWIGNKIHSAADLDRLLSYRVGDRYDKDQFEVQLLGGRDPRSVGSLYMNDGYLFFRIDTSEKRIGGQVELTLNVYEGERVWINSVKTVFHKATSSAAEEVHKSIDVHPGELFDRSRLLSSQEKLARSGIVKRDSIQINPYPLQHRDKDGRRLMDIEFVVSKL